MSGWKEKAFKKVFNLQWPMEIKGLGGWSLRFDSFYGYVVNYTLEAKLNISRPKEEDYLKSKNYFYALVSKNPEVYSFVSQATGGAIVFKGKGRWSGNAKDFGNDIKKKLDDIYISGIPGFYAMNINDVVKNVKSHFPGLEFEITKDSSGYQITVDWSKIKEDKEEQDKLVVNEEPIYGTTGPLPLPVGSTKPVIKPNVNDKKKLLILKLKKLIRDEVKKALLFDTDRPGEIKTRTKDFQKIDIKV